MDRKAPGFKQLKQVITILFKTRLSNSKPHPYVAHMNPPLQLKRKLRLRIEGPGPGSCVEACEVLASEKREVASYDQIGCARSPFAKDAPAGTYTPELFTRELSRVREAGGLERCHVVAHGWGGMLALDHILVGWFISSVRSLVHPSVRSVSSSIWSKGPFRRRPFGPKVHSVWSIDWSIHRYIHWSVRVSLTCLFARSTP